MSDVVDTIREKIAEKSKSDSVLDSEIVEAESKLSRSVFEAYKEFAYEVYKRKFDNALIAYDIEQVHERLFSEFHVMSLAYDLIADLQIEHELEDLFHNTVLSSSVLARIDQHIEKHKKLAS